MQQENQLEQVIDLIEKTGDKAVVLEQGRPAYVLMRLKDYEGLILAKSEVQGLTREEMQDKINREIAIWKSNQERMSEISQRELGLDDDWEEEMESDWMEEDGRRGTEDEGRNLDVPDFGDQDLFDERDEFDDDEFDSVEDKEVPLFDNKDVFDDREGFDNGGRFDDEDDEFDVDKEMRKVERERGGRDRDEESRSDFSTGLGSSLNSSRGSESRFEEDRFYVEPV